MSVDFPSIRQDKGEVIPVQAYCRCIGFQEVETPRFQESAHEGSKFVSPSAPAARNSPGNHFYQRLSRPQDHSATGRIKSMTKAGITLKYCLRIHN